MSHFHADDGGALRPLESAGGMLFESSEVHRRRGVDIGHGPQTAYDSESLTLAADCRFYLVDVSKFYLFDPDAGFRNVVRLRSPFRPITVVEAARWFYKHHRHVPAEAVAAIADHAIEPAPASPPAAVEAIETSPASPEPRAITRGDAEPTPTGIDYAALASALRRKRKAKPGALVEYMATRAEATVDDVADKVHGDAEAGDKTVSANVRRTNDALAELGSPLRFRVASGRVFRETIRVTVEM